MSEAKSEGGKGNGTSSAPIYMRLQNRAQAESKRSGPAPAKTRWRSLSLGFIVLLCLTCAIWLLVQYVDSDPRFHLRSIDLRGGQFVARSEVEDVFAADREISLYRIPLEQRRLEIERIPWVRSATITRILPDRLAIEVKEREPVAFLWTRKGIELVDRDGVILETPPGKGNGLWTFPVLRGVPERGKAEKRKARMDNYLELLEGLRQADGKIPSEISEVDLTNPADVCVVATDASGALRLHLGDEKFRDRYEVYRSHIAEWRQQFNEIHSIDLRYDGQVVIQSGVPLTVPVDSKSKVSARPPAGAFLPKEVPSLPVSASARTAL